MEHRFTTESAEATQQLAAALGQILTAGAVVGLSGDLGAGKTCFSQGLARGLGCDPTVPVTSPTFTIINIYPGPTPLTHIDLYRLGSEEELEMVGYRDLLGEGVMVVEWFQRMPDAFPADHLEIQFHLNECLESRELAVRSHGPRSDTLLSAWCASPK